MSRAVFTGGLSNKPFLIWLLTTPPHLKHAATLPCNLSLIACFLELMFTQDSVATCARRVEFFNSRFTANLQTNLPTVNRLRFDKIMAVSFGPSCIASCGTMNLLVNCSTKTMISSADMAMTGHQSLHDIFHRHQQ